MLPNGGFTLASVILDTFAASSGLCLLDAFWVQQGMFVHAYSFNGASIASNDRRKKLFCNCRLPASGASSSPAGIPP